MESFAYSFTCRPIGDYRIMQVKPLSRMMESFSMKAPNKGDHFGFSRRMNRITTVSWQHLRRLCRSWGITRNRKTKAVSLDEAASATVRVKSRRLVSVLPKAPQIIFDHSNGAGWRCLLMGWSGRGSAKATRAARLGGSGRPPIAVISDDC